MLLLIVDQIFAVDSGCLLYHTCSGWTPKFRIVKFG